MEIQNIQKEELHQNFSISTIPYESSSPSLWNSSGSQVLHSCLSKSVSSNPDTPLQHYQNVKRLGLQLQDQDSSSSQSTDQSVYVSATEGVKPHGSEEIRMEAHSKLVLSEGAQHFDLPPSQLFGLPSSQLHYNQSLTYRPYSFTDPHFDGLSAGYGIRTMIHSPEMSVSARVPLPLHLMGNQPIYVNAKQYHGILRRRESRAKLEARNKLLKERKPYLHESRHLHAIKRVRGTGGRFLNMKKLQEPGPSFRPFDTDKISESSSSIPQAQENLSEVLQSSVTTSCSQVISVFNSDGTFESPGPGLSSYLSLEIDRDFSAESGGFTRDRHQQYHYPSLTGSRSSQANWM